MQYSLANTLRKGLLTKLSGSATDVLLGDGTFGTFASILAATTRFKVGSFTRDISTASGSQAVTGVGFTPKAILFFAAFTGASIAGSVGFSNVTTNRSYVNYLTAGQVFTEATAIDLITGVTPDQATAVVASFDADGFTLTWTKTNSPTGTATLSYLAFR